MKRVVVLMWPLVLLGCGEHEPAAETQQSQPIEISVSEVRSQAVPRLYEASGTLTARNTAVLSAKLAGYVTQLPATPGDSVERGTVLVVIEAPELVADRRRAEAALGAAEAALNEAASGAEAAAAQLRVAEATYERFQQLIEQRAATRQEFDEVEARYKSAQAQQRMAQAGLRRAEASVAQARAAVSAAQAMEGYTRVRAPFDALVTEHYVDTGAMAAPGVPLVKVEEQGASRVEVAVDESLVGRIELGDSARVEIGSELTLAASVVEVVPQVDPATRSFKVKLQLPSEQPALRPGLFARVRFELEPQETLLIPVSAVQRRGQLDRVLVVSDGRLRLRVVTLGRRRGEQVEVLSGLSPGEQLLHVWDGTLADGQPVTVKG